MGTKILFNNRHPAQIIAFVLLICVASIILLQNTQAGGGSADIHLELNIKENISIKDLRNKIINYVDEKFKGNENYKKIIKSSAFCSEDNNIVSDNYQITKDQKIGIIPPIGGG